MTAARTETKACHQSLACEVRTRYGYGRSPHAFAEFLWANFFQIRIIIDNWILKNETRGSDILIRNLPAGATFNLGPMAFGVR